MVILLSKITMMLGFSFYLSIALLNNIIDKKTNRFLLAQMLEMKSLKEDGVLGQGLLYRACRSQTLPVRMLNGICAIQFIITILLWCGSILLIMAALHDVALYYAIDVCVIALTGFMGLWFFFWCGGLWFGYWIKMGQIQEVHMRLIILSLLAIIFIHFGISS